MKTSKFTEEQIAFALWPATRGDPCPPGSGQERGKEPELSRHRSADFHSSALFLACQECSPATH
jgi:hypothetical protein